MVAFENVASLYQTGVRSEKNPDYDAAQARLREAERERRRGGPDILEVGDPLLDLVGLLVGGVIATFSHLGSHGDVNAALAALKETPRSRDRPVYAAYEFERSTVRAGKEATIPIALRDLRRGQIWRTQLRQREMRQFAVVAGLDPRDRDYEQHRAGAFSWEEFKHWQSQPPQLPVSALVAALLEIHDPNGGPQTSGSELIVDAGSSISPRGSADPGDLTVGEHPAALSLAAAIEPGADPGLTSLGAGAPAGEATVTARLPDPAPGRKAGASTDAGVFAAATDPRMASVVRLEPGLHPGGGLYVKPRLVVTTADLVGTASVIDVTTSDGEKVLGLVVHTDASRNLAVVHVPRSGPPAPLLEKAASRSTDTAEVLELLGDDRARLTLATLRRPVGHGAATASSAPVELELARAPVPVGAPVFVNERAVGLVAAGNGEPGYQFVPIDALATLLDSEPLAALR